MYKSSRPTSPRSAITSNRRQPTHTQRHAPSRAQRATTRALPTHLTPEQRRWLHTFEEQTNLEPLHLSELQAGRLDFDYVARANINQFECWMHHAFNTITRNVPYSNDDDTRATPWYNR